jgi:adenine/guanine phosphoribosyltransferase-like PRPP-binding protein
MKQKANRALWQIGARVVTHRELQQKLNKLGKAVSDDKIDFDAVAFCGISGALVAAPLALLYGVDLLGVREPETSGSTYLGNGDYGRLKTYIIVDDCIVTGATVDHIKRTLSSMSCVGVFCYK